MNEDSLRDRLKVTDESGLEEKRVKTPTKNFEGKKSRNPKCIAFPTINILARKALMFFKSRGHFSSSF